MATAAEQTFNAAVMKAEGIRQSAYAAAFTAYGFVAANLATYITALEAADNAYVSAVNSAASTLGAAGYTIPNSGPSAGNVVPSMAKMMATPSVIGGGSAASSMGAIA